jgi:hypothetical protein
MRLVSLCTLGSWLSRRRSDSQLTMDWSPPPSCVRSCVAGTGDCYRSAYRGGRQEAGTGLPGPDSLAASPHAIDLAIHHAVGPILRTPLSRTMVTDDTSDTTFGKLFRRGDIRDFPKLASSSVTCHLTCPAQLLVKKWGLCVGYHL